MSEATATPGTGPAPRSRTGRRVGVAIGGLGIAAAAGVWLARVPIATDFIDRELARRGVAARYTVSDMGSGGSG